MSTPSSTCGKMGLSNSYAEYEKGSAAWKERVFVTSWSAGVSVSRSQPTCNLINRDKGSSEKLYCVLEKHAKGQTITFGGGACDDLSTIPA